MPYLDDILRATQKTRGRTAQSRSVVSTLAANLAAQAATPKAPVTTQPSAAPARGGKSGGPHHAGDGHKHGGGAQTVGEANELWRRLQKMVSESPHKITPGKRSRSYEEQVRLWNLYKAGKGAMAARPGTSKHGNGRANDLQYSSDAARAWALANANRYGLAFPLYNPKLGRGRDESWHVELQR